MTGRLSRSISLAAAVIGYFGVNAFTGNRGLRRASSDLEQQMRRIRTNSTGSRPSGPNGSSACPLLRSDRIDPDMLDERARALLDYAHPTT